MSPSKNLNFGNWSTSKFNQITLTTLIIEKFTWSCQSFKKFSWILLNNNTDFTKSILLHPTTWLNSISYSKMLYYLQKLLILDLSIFRFSTKIMPSFCGDFLKVLPPQAWNKLGLESCGLRVLIPCKFTSLLLLLISLILIFLFFLYFMALFSQSSFKHRLVTSS